MSDEKYLHQKVYDDLKNKILSGKYPLNSLIPKEFDLERIYKVSRHTIRKALDRLSQEGLLRKVKGQGTFVNEIKADYSLSNMASFTEIIHNQGGDPNSIVFSARIEDVDRSIAQKLDCKDHKVYVVKRLRRNGDVNLCYEITYVSPKLCPNIDQYVSPNSSLFELYEKRYQLTLGNGEYSFEATGAVGEIAKILDVPIASPILFMRARIFTELEAPVYYVEAYYIGSRYIFSTILNR
jgi:GntR family transcriptional regulator